MIEELQHLENRVKEEFQILLANRSYFVLNTVKRELFSKIVNSFMCLVLKFPDIELHCR